MEKLSVPAPDFDIFYGHVKETAILSPFVERISVIDYMTGQSDEAEITMDNTQGYFSGHYFPLRGDDFEVSMGWKSGPLQGLWAMGGFSIDEAQVQGPPDQVVIRGLAATVKAPLRSPRSRAYEGQTLRQIAEKVGAACGLVVVASGLDTPFLRVTQHRETDLAFLARLAKANGCYMKVKAGEIILQPIGSLLTRDSGVGVGRADVMRFNIRSKTSEANRATVTRYWDPTKRDQVIFQTSKPDVGTVNTHPAPTQTGTKPGARTMLGKFAPKVDVGKVFERVENSAQAQARIDAIQQLAAVGNVAGTIEVQGDPRLRGGGTVYLFPEDFGTLGGWYVITRAQHTIDRGGGYVTALDLSNNPDPPATQPKKPKPATAPAGGGK